jgi:acetolactate synthase-1/3 small subunit
MYQVLVVYTDDEPGVLNRVASLFRRRAFNIHSLTVGPTQFPGVSRMTIVVATDAMGALRAQRHLEKLLNVQRVETLSDRASVVRDLVLVRVAANMSTRPQLMQLALAFRATVVDVAADSLILECTGSAGKIDALLDVLNPYGVLETGRTGVVAMARGTGFYGGQSAHTAAEALASNF